ncbi:MAG: hypothetical protein LBF63_10720, partial [Treponema sp.]|nr:hypothetical protein [Treponema sp.]
MIKRKSTGANPVTAGDIIITILCGGIILICLLPLVNLAARSLSSANALVRNQVTLFPVGLNWDAYTTILHDARYIRSLWWTASLT